MILAGIQPSTVWFRVLQGMAAPACDQLCGGSLGPCAPQLPGVWVLQAGTGLLGKNAEARGLFGKAQQGSVTSGPVFYWSGSSLGKPVHWPAIAKLPNSTVGLAVSCNGPFWGDLPNTTAGMPVPSRAVLGAGSSQERGLAGPVRLKAARPSGRPLACVTSMAASSQGQRQGTRCVPCLAVP